MAVLTKPQLEAQLRSAISHKDALITLMDHLAAQSLGVDVPFGALSREQQLLLEKLPEETKEVAATLLKIHGSLEIGIIQFKQVEVVNNDGVRRIEEEPAWGHLPVQPMRQNNNMIKKIDQCLTVDLMLIPKKLSLSQNFVICHTEATSRSSQVCALEVEKTSQARVVDFMTKCGCFQSNKQDKIQLTEPGKVVLVMSKTAVSKVTGDSVDVTAIIDRVPTIIRLPLVSLVDLMSIIPTLAGIGIANYVVCSLTDNLDLDIYVEGGVLEAGNDDTSKRILGPTIRKRKAYSLPFVQNQPISFRLAFSPRQTVNLCIRGRSPNGFVAKTCKQLIHRGQLAEFN